MAFNKDGECHKTTDMLAEMMTDCKHVCRIWLSASHLEVEDKVISVDVNSPAMVAVDDSWLAKVSLAVQPITIYL